jgi:glucokinase
MVEKTTAMTRKKYAIGVDMGATTIKAGLVDKSGEIHAQATVDTKADRGPAAVVKQLTFAIRELLGRCKQTEVAGVGIGSPGVVNIEAGTVSHPPNFTDWGDIALPRLLRKNIPLPVYIENDANCAAIAEARYGAGIEYKDFLFVIWGTGVGGGVILNRKIYRGPYGGAGEIGHVSVDYNGRKCNCGNYGCVEAYIGQRYLSARTKEILEAADPDRAPSKIVTLVEGRLNKIEPAIISMAAEQGDPLATEILEEAGLLMGSALASILNVLDIRIVVIGGGISAAPQFVFNTIEQTLRRRVLKPHRDGVHVLRAKLGNPAGIVGAASLVQY